MKMNTRPIPSSGENLPVVGCGTYVGFDVQPGTDAYRELPAVLQALFDEFLRVAPIGPHQSLRPLLIHHGM